MTPKQRARMDEMKAALKRQGAEMRKLRKRLHDAEKLIEVLRNSTESFLNS